MLDAPVLPVCAVENWKHVCHLSEGHHGPHACTAPGDKLAAQYGGCEFTWPNENEVEPCPSTEVAILGAVGSPARLRCGLLFGHDGPHRYVMEWA